MRYRLLAILLLVSFSAFAQDDIPQKPREKALVYDLTEKTLSNSEIRSLQSKLENYQDSTSTQIAVVFVNSLQGYEVVDFAQRTAQKWGVGQSDKDNGIMILVSINDRKAAIVTGYGMEGSITDAATYTIREDYMNPNFRNGDYYRGIDEATDVLMKLASGEFTSDQVSRGRTSSGNGKGLPFGLIFIIFFFIVPAIFGRRRGRNSMGRRSFPWWIFLLGGGSGGGRNDWDNFRGGGGGFGGGGGGFGGFGGGSFGGGGSGGSW